MEPVPWGVLGPVDYTAQFENCSIVGGVLSQPRGHTPNFCKP